MITTKFLNRLCFAGAAALFFTQASASGQSLSVRSTVTTGDPVSSFGESAAEIVAYDPKSERLFVSNASTDSVDVIDISDPDNPTFLFAIVTGGSPNSVAVNPLRSRGEIAIAVEASPKQNPGSVEFYDTDGNFLKAVTVGALPDMVTYGPHGRYVYTANEGEPNDDYTIDPEGSVSIIDVRRPIKKLTQDKVTTVSFSELNSQEEALKESGVRIFGPGATVAQDLEPEYVAVDPGGDRIYVVCQENNAIIDIDVRSKSISNIFALGTKDHSLAGNELDPSNRDAGIVIGNWPVQGFYLPDAIAAYKPHGGKGRRGGLTYIVTANEGDSRDYDGFSEELRGEDLVLDPVAFPDAATLQLDENLGRLKTTTANGDTDGDGDNDIFYSYGARSFSIWTTDGVLVYDSGSDFENITAALLPGDFNATNDENDSFDNRSDDKGPEPEGLVLGKVGNKTYAFIGLERVGGIMVYDISNPISPVFCDYANNRDFSVTDQGAVEAGLAGDLGPEGLTFIPARLSPSGGNLLVVTNEVSGTITIYDFVAPGSEAEDDDEDED